MARGGNNPSTPASASFLFVTNFENDQLDGWQKVSGATPTIVSNPNYSGEPTLKSSTTSGTQTDYATQNITAGSTLFYFQVAIFASSSSKGYFGLGESSNKLVAVVGVQGGKIVAGSSLKNLKTIESVPKGTAYPAGWVYISGQVNNFGKSPNMTIFVDGTNNTPTTVKLPDVSHYSGALIETTKGTVYFSDIYVTSMFIPSRNPGYNSIEGYGNGCCGTDLPLADFYNLTATVKISSWSVPQNNIQSWQINVGNATNFNTDSCAGFFQLGFDFNENGYIAPWHVNGTNTCGAYYFKGSDGFTTPKGSVLTLSIVWDSSNKSISFRIYDENTSQTFSISIPYSGGAFEEALTQYEFESYAIKPIADFKANLVVYGYQFTAVGSTNPQNFNLSDQYPFMVNAPPSWELAYYNEATAGYQQIAT